MTFILATFWTIIVLQIILTILTPIRIGAPRKPMTPAEGVATIAVNAAFITVFIFAAVFIGNHL